MNQRLTTALVAAFALSATAFAGELDKKTVAPLTPLDDAWRFSLSMPGWIPWQVGDTGLHGVITHLDLGPDDLVPKFDIAADVRFEARKGRFGILGEFFYMSLSDGKATNTVVKKVDLQVDQAIADLAVAWRLIDSARGYLAVVGGVRYTNYHQQLALQPNDRRIDEIAGGLATAGTLLRARVAQALTALDNQNPTLPIAPLGGGEAARLTAKIAQLKGSTAERQAKIARLLHDALDRTVSRTDDWWDPYLGLRGRYNLSEKFYLTGKADVGGFTVGCDLTWTAEAALGCQLGRNLFAEVGYRALGVDYDEDGFVLDTVTHGPQVTLGFNF